MDPTFEAFLQSWPFDPWVVVPLVLTALAYIRGWRQLRQRGARRFGPTQLYCFLGGLASLFFALASPIEPFADLLLQVHMLQHLLLMMVAPPLLWLGAPLIPLLRGLPVPIRSYWVGPFFQLRLVRLCFERLTHPVTAWVLYVAASWFWHAPRFYDLALRSPAWHYVEHAFFLGSALLFWWPVVQPYPSRQRWPRWAMVPYLLAADVQNTILSALLTFSERVLYPHYAAAPRVGGISALDDQAMAGVLMWIPGSLAFLIPVVWTGKDLLYGQPGRETASHRRSEPAAHNRRIALPLIAPATPSPKTVRRWFDLLRVPLLGHFLRWRYARPILQSLTFLLAVVVIIDGLLGPRIAPMNLAGVLPWLHWRGLVVLILLLAGNFFCMACPFLLPRTLARRWLPARHAWPRWLRSKWLAVALLALFFWAYEAFALWSSPWWTAWIAIAYFLAAFAVDGWFRGAAFCKYVCPIGQFNFVQSLISPLEVRIRDAELCLRCVTKDCIRGNAVSTGCELHLFLPRKAGNLDCTFCLDCIHACPHDNIGIVAGTPAAELWHDPHRSGVGRFGRRPDLAALALVLVFGAFANAAGMVAPVVEWQDRLTAAFQLTSPFWIVTLGFIVALVVLPMLLVGAAAAVGRAWSGDDGSGLDVAIRFTYALVPLGAAMWLTHYSFHFLTSYGTLIPVTQRWALDWGMTSLGAPEWSCTCCVAVASWLLRLEMLFLDAGLLLSLYTAYRIARERTGQFPRAVCAFAPWGALLLLLFGVGIWIVFQPMEMRGAVMPG
ncbi:MAG: cytochrome c oxidase assembly protein [Gemmataceae bacterium]|nr:cytochrome c oxidase assembly protein [Gemmataceae bacterium]